MQANRLRQSRRKVDARAAARRKQKRVTAIFPVSSSSPLSPISMLPVANPPAAPCRQSVHRDSHHPSCLYFPRAASQIYPARKLEWHRLLPPKVETLPNFSFDSPPSLTQHPHLSPT